MSWLPQTNAPWCDPVDTNTISGGYPITPTIRMTDRDIELLHRERQYIPDLHHVSHPLTSEIQGNGAYTLQPIISRSSGPRHMTINDLTVDSNQSYTVAPVQASTSANGGSQYPSMTDSASNGVEHDAASLIQTTALTERRLEHLAVRDLALPRFDHHIAGLVQAPSADQALAIHNVDHHIAAPTQVLVQGQTFSKCVQCLEKARHCTGGQENSKSCNACKNAKRGCSFLPRKYACGLCQSLFAREVDLKTHTTRKHKLLSLDAPKEFQYPQGGFGGIFSNPHPAAMHQDHSSALVRILEGIGMFSRLEGDDTSPSQDPLSHHPLQIDCAQSIAVQQDQATPSIRIESARKLSGAVQREMPHFNELYQPDSPAYAPAQEPSAEIHHTSPLSEPRQSSPVEHTLAQNQAVNTGLEQGRPVQPTETLVRPESTRFASPNLTSPVVLQQLSPVRLRQISSSENLTPYQNSNADIYLQFPNRVMADNHVERSLGAIRKQVKDYEEFIRGTDPQYTTAEVEDQFNFLKKIQPFVCMKEVQEEAHDFFASQPSRIVVLWRLLLDVHPTASLRDELIRFELEGLELPVVICGTLAYILFRTIFDEPNRLRTAENIARFESVKELHGRKFAEESIKHDELFIHQDRSVDRELRKLARDLTERQFYGLLHPLTHWDLTNPTTKMKEVHIKKLSDIASRSLRLSRELQARTTEHYSYFWPRPGEPFNPIYHIDIEDSQLKSQSGMIISWTLMFGVKANREGQHEFLYAKAIVMTMEA